MGATSHAERSGFENQCTGRCTGGSNPGRPRTGVTSTRPGRPG